MQITIDGYRINYEISGPDGSTKAAAVLQGWGTELGMYESVATAIDDEYKVIRLDLPGFGGSDEPKEAWSVDDYSDFFCKFMKELRIEKTSLIGHSYGGRMIIKMAARAHRSELPFEIDKIVLIDSAGVMPDRSTAQRFKVKRYKAIRKIITSRPVHAMFPEVIDYWLGKQGSEDYKNASPIMKQCLVKAVNEDLRDIMPDVRQDVLLLWGDNDLDTPISDAHIMEELMPFAGLVVFKGAGHYSFLEQPALFRDVIRSFLIDAAGATADNVSSKAGGAS